MKPVSNSRVKKSFLKDFKEIYPKVRPYYTALLIISLSISPAIQNLYWKIGVLTALAGALVFLVLDLSNLSTVFFVEIKSRLIYLDKNFKSEIIKLENEIIRLENFVKQVEKGDPLYEAAFNRNLGRPEIQVATKLYGASKRAAIQLINPESFEGQERFLHELEFRINRMIRSKSGKIMAVCGEKNWKHPGIRQWFLRNVAALQAGVTVDRIFIESIEWDRNSVEKEMKEQAKYGINVRFASLKNLQNHEVLRNLPKGFGFVIFDYGDNIQEVIVHNDPATEKSVLFTNVMIVAQFIHTFHNLSANMYSDVVERDDENQKISA